MLYCLFMSRVFSFGSWTALVNIGCFKTDAKVDVNNIFSQSNLASILVIENDETLIAFRLEIKSYGMCFSRMKLRVRKWNREFEFARFKSPKHGYDGIVTLERIDRKPYVIHFSLSFKTLVQVTVSRQDAFSGPNIVPGHCNENTRRALVQQRRACGEK